MPSGPLHLRPPSQNPGFLNSQKNSVLLHSRKRPGPVKDTLDNTGDNTVTQTTKDFVHMAFCIKFVVDLKHVHW